MIIKKAYKCGCCRVVYNQALNFKIKKYQEEKESISYSATSAFLTGLKQNKDFFKKRAHFPTFKTKNSIQSISFTKSGFRWDGDAFNMAKSKESLKIRWSRRLIGIPSGVRITKDTYEYFIGILPEEQPIQFQQRNHFIEINVGLESCLTTSNGKKLISSKPFKHFKKKLKNNQKRLSKFESTGKNRNKRRIKVTKIHSKNIRHDFYHKLFTQLIRENQAIIIEGL